MASVFQVCDRTRLSGGDMALLLYLCGWLCGNSLGGKSYCNS
ncbi:hypothetical protein QUB75_09585 [Microcoleus sp. K1-B6]